LPTFSIQLVASKDLTEDERAEVNFETLEEAYDYLLTKMLPVSASIEQETESRAVRSGRLLDAFAGYNRVGWRLYEATLNTPYEYNNGKQTHIAPGIDTRTFIGWDADVTSESHSSNGSSSAWHRARVKFVGRIGIDPVSMIIGTRSVTLYDRDVF
jgi:hypothetical protein